MSVSPENTGAPFASKAAIHETEDREDSTRQIQTSLNELVTPINSRELAYYIESEIQTGQQWFPTSSTTSIYRYGFRFVYHWDAALPNTTTTNMAHGIPNASQITWFTHLYGVAVDNAGPRWLSLPNAECSILADATNVTLTTTADLSAYDGAYIVMEYLKQV